MTTEWPFHETYRVDLPPTQVKSAVERCKKKNIVDLSAPSDETQNIIQAVFASYSKKKERARAASSRSRAAKSGGKCATSSSKRRELLLNQMVPCGESHLGKLPISAGQSRSTLKLEASMRLEFENVGGSHTITSYCSPLRL